MRAMKCLLISVGLVLVTCGEGGRDGRAGLQYTLTIAPGNYLFIYGHEFHGDVLCTLEPGDSFRIGGLPVYPRRLPPPAVSSDEGLRGLYGEVPFVQERVKEGDSWGQAVDAFKQRRAEMEQSARRVYSREVERTGSSELAAKAALDSLDRSLLDPAFEPELIGSMILVRLEGEVVPYGFDLPTEPPSPPAVRRPQVATPAKAREILEQLSRTVGPEASGVWMELFTHSGETILGGRSEVSKALKAIEEIRKADSTSGPLSFNQLRAMERGPVGLSQMEEILAVRRASAK